MLSTIKDDENEENGDHLPPGSGERRGPVRHLRLRGQPGALQPGPTEPRVGKGQSPGVPGHSQPRRLECNQPQPGANRRHDEDLHVGRPQRSRQPQPEPLGGVHGHRGARRRGDQPLGAAGRHSTDHKLNFFTLITSSGIASPFFHAASSADAAHGRLNVFRDTRHPNLKGL